MWSRWIAEALAAPEVLDRIYGDLLTDRVSSGWRQAHIDENDRNPSASVCDTGQAQRGTWKDFRSGESMSIFDWLISRGRATKFVEAAKIVAEASGVRIPGKPLLILKGQPSEMAENAWNTVIKNDEESLFIRDGQLIRLPIDDDDQGDHALRSLTYLPVDEREARALIYESAHVKRPGKEVKSAGQNGPSTLVDVQSLPSDMVNQFLMRPDRRVRKLRRMVPHPVLSKGRLVYKNGYDTDSRLLLRNCPDIDLPTVITKEDAVAAASEILEEIYGDFPFESSASKAHALLIPLSAIMRESTGLTPPFVLSSSAPGSGKGLLSDVAIAILQGKSPSMPPPKDPEELRKRVEAKLINGEPIIKIDNMNGGIYSSHLASLWTSEWPDIRPLGTSKMIKCENVSLWIINGINIEMSGELARRPVGIRLVPREARPDLRNNFKLQEHELLEYIETHRGQLMRNLLMMIQFWVQSGMPKGSYGFGSFNKWASIMGKILELSGVPGFLENRDDLRNDMDTESGERVQLVLAWWEKYGSTEVTPRQVMEEVCLKHELFSTYLDYYANDRSQVTKFGNLLAKERDRIYAGYFIRRKEKKPGHRVYWLEPISPDQDHTPAVASIAEPAPVDVTEISVEDLTVKDIDGPAPVTATPVSELDDLDQEFGLYYDPLFPTN